MEACEFVGWGALSLEAQAAWVQAIGSIAAILVAILVAAWQHHVEKRARSSQERSRARSLSIALLPKLSSLMATLKLVKSGTDFRPLRISFPDIGRQLELPEELKVAALQAHELGAASEHFQNMLLSVDVARNLSANVAGGGGLFRQSYGRNVEDDIQAAVDKALESAEKTVAAIKKMFEEKIQKGAQKSPA